MTLGTQNHNKHVIQDSDEDQQLQISIIVHIYNHTKQRQLRPIYADTWWSYDRSKIIFPGMILGLHPANERRRYKVTPSLIGWAQI